MNNLYKGNLRHSGEEVVGNLLVSVQGNSYIIPTEVLYTDGHHLVIDSDLPYCVDPTSIRLADESKILCLTEREFSLLQDSSQCFYLTISNKLDNNKDLGELERKQLESFIVTFKSLFEKLK